MVLLDLLGRRWTLRVLWELREPAASFRELQERCDGMSSSVLNTRIAELRDAGIVEADAYALTRDGRELFEVLMPVQRWAERWAKRRP